MKTNKIHNENCLVTMSKMDDDFVDIAVTSPPYNTGGQNAQTGRNRKLYDEYKDDLSDEEYYYFIKNTITELIRVTKYYVFFNFQILTKNKSCYLKLMGEIHENIKDVFIWKKQAISQIVKGKMATGYEIVLIIGKDNEMKYPYNNFPQNNYVPNIQSFKKTQTFHKINNATMPVSMAEYFIFYFSKDNDLVYDPFMGMGTTACAAIKNNRRWIGSEISEDYIKLSYERFHPLLNQTKLF
tara:strand:+ start:228 stop:947 length:720 start_codon:yes stop_codon:yes gene_type:complete